MRRVRNEKERVSGLELRECAFDFPAILCGGALHTLLLHSEILVRRNRILLLKENACTNLAFSPKPVIYSLRKNMSASAAKVSKKELNSNHDGADETSGKEWRPPVHRHFHFLH